MSSKLKKLLYSLIMMEELKNIFGKPQFFPKGIEEYYSYSTNELTELLKKHNNNGYVKSRICTELGRRKELIPIFKELENMENQKMEALFGLSVAQILELIIIDNGNRNDIEYLISKINKWEIKHQKEDFIYFLESNDIFIL